jgi:DNA-binding MarR family transcriptional regulator
MNDLDALFLEFEHMISKIKAFDIFSKIEKGELFVLKFLNDKSGKITPGRIGAALGSSPARISGALCALEKRGEILRLIDKDNRRQVLVEITDKGKCRVAEVLLEMKSVFFSVVEEMGIESVKSFIELASSFFEVTKSKFFNSTPTCLTKEF